MPVHRAPRSPSGDALYHRREKRLQPQAFVPINPAPSGETEAQLSIIDMRPSETPLKSIAPGKVVFAQGEAGDAMFVVIDGEIDILIDGKLIERVRAGSGLGERALIDAGPRSATAVARSRVLLSPVHERRPRLQGVWKHSEL